MACGGGDRGGASSSTDAAQSTSDRSTRCSNGTATDRAPRSCTHHCTIPTNATNTPRATIRNNAPCTGPPQRPTPIQKRLPRRIPRGGIDIIRRPCKDGIGPRSGESAGGPGNVVNVEIAVGREIIIVVVVIVVVHPVGIANGKGPRTLPRNRKRRSTSIRGAVIIKTGRASIIAVEVVGIGAGIGVEIIIAVAIGGVGIAKGDLGGTSGVVIRSVVDVDVAASCLCLTLILKDLLGLSLVGYGSSVDVIVVVHECILNLIGKGSARETIVCIDEWGAAASINIVERIIIIVERIIVFTLTLALAESTKDSSGGRRRSLLLLLLPVITILILLKLLLFLLLKLAQLAGIFLLFSRIRHKVS